MTPVSSLSLVVPISCIDHLIAIADYCLGLVVPISCIDHLIVSATPFSLVFLSGMYFYQLLVSGPSIFLVIVSATPLSYSYQHTVSIIR